MSSKINSFQKNVQFLLLFLVLTASVLNAKIWYVDADEPSGQDGESWSSAFNNIADAVSAATNLWVVCYAPLDKIYVKSGTYTLSSEITMNKVVTVYGGFPNSMSEPGLSDRDSELYSTVIDGDNSVRCMMITSYCVIDGFVFTNGYSTLNAGAVYIDKLPVECSLGNDLSVTIRNCKFVDNYAGVHGGAIYDFKSDALIQGCTFVDNVADAGGAIKQWWTSSRIERCYFEGNHSTSTGGFGGGAILGDYLVYGSVTNCVFYDNSSLSNGGAISYHTADPAITNCTFNVNTCSGNGGAIYTNTAEPVLRNCILWDDSPQEIANYHSDGARVYYSDIDGGYTGTGSNNINTSPLFVSMDDLRLAVGSPCVDTGSNSSAPSDDLLGVDRPLDGDGDGVATVDMGAYELEYIDLRIVGIYYLPKVAIIGEPVTVRVVIRNYGTSDAGEFWVDWYANRTVAPSLGDVGNKYEQVASLAAGASYTFETSYTYGSVGTFNMYAQVDTESSVAETNETNNITGPIPVRINKGEPIKFAIKSDQHNASMWFGGDDGAVKRNVGVGQSITPVKAVKIEAAGFNFSGRFDYENDPDNTGHEVVLLMRVLNSDGSYRFGVVKTVPASFNGGWVMFGFGDRWLEANETYIFTCYVYQGEYNELCSGVYGSTVDPWPDSTGYSAAVVGLPANLASWPNWIAHSWDFNFRLEGYYVEEYPGDINDDRSVDFRDVAVMSTEWLNSDCLMPLWCESADIDWNGTVRFEDYATVAANWRKEYHDYEDLNAAAVKTFADGMSVNKIDASDGNEFSAGTYFVYKTSAGRYGKFIVEDFDSSNRELTIAWTTYNANGTVYTSGAGLVIRGTFSCDLDLGLETSSIKYDFSWVQATISKRYLLPANGAVFKLVLRVPYIF